MNENITLLNRPPIGFIVEGRGEYNCYPSLVCRIIDSSGFKVPRVNAGGYGNILRHLRDQLQALVLADHPFHVIVTVDLKEVIELGLHSDCRQLRADLEKQAKDWLVNARCDHRLQPLPELITVVVQVQKFESWMIADVSSLRESGCLRAEEPQFSNVDEEIRDPAAWLRNRISPALNFKNPKCAKCIISCLDLTVVRKHSPSFDKFHREVLSSYNCWCQACHIP